MSKDIWLRPVLHVVLALAGGFGIWFFLPKGPHLTEHSVGRIKPGMSLTDVENVFGFSGQDWSGKLDLLEYHPCESWSGSSFRAAYPFGDVAFMHIPAGVELPLSKGRLLLWKNEQMAVCVEVDGNEKVIDLAYGRRNMPEGLLEYLLDRFRR